MNPKLLKLAGIGRLILGLLILASVFFGVPVLAHRSFAEMIMFLVAPTPVIFIIYPIIIVGLYFTFTARFRWRIDVFALTILTLCFAIFYQFSNPNRGDIRGEAKLEITVLTENQKPVANLEVDVAEEPGQPPEGGVLNTNEQGVAAFSIKPGDYVVYFNSGNFPPNLEYPQDSTPVKVEAQKINQKTIILKSR